MGSTNEVTSYVTENGIPYKVVKVLCDEEIVATFWYDDKNRFHRKDGPAAVFASGNKYWYRKDKLHREDGPSCEYSDGGREWHFNGKEYTKKEFEEKYSSAVIAPEGNIKRIHINMHNIRKNKKEGTSLPVITVKTSKANHKGNEVTIDGPSTVKYSPDKPLSCGARVWVETHAEVLIKGDS